MSKILILILIATITGCTSSTAPEFGTREPDVPQQFRNAVGWHGSQSDFSLYIDAYGDGYWRCIGNYVEDINYVSKEEDKIAIGRGAKVSGYWVGYEDAEIDIKRNIKKFGKEQTHQVMVEWWEGK